MSGGRSTLICKGKPKDSLAAQNTYSGALRSHTVQAGLGQMREACAALFSVRSSFRGYCGSWGRAT